MRWQKIARFAIVLFVVGFAVVVFRAMRQRPAAADVGAATLQAPPDVVLVSGAGKRQEYDFGKLRMALTYEKALSYRDGRSTLAGVKVELPDRNERTFFITADEAEMLSSPEKPGEVAGAKFWGNVKLRTDNGVEVLSSEATFNDADGIVRIPGPVSFTRGRMKGTGVGATYDRNRDVIWLLADAHLTVTPDAAGGGAVEATSSTAGLAKADNFVKLVGAARLIADTRTAQADEITALLDEKGETIQQLQLRERSRITGTGAGAQTMTARHIDMMYAADGRTLQGSKLMEGGVVEFPGAAGASGQRIAGTTIESAMSPDGATVTNLTAVEKVQVDLPGAGDTPAKRIRAATLRASGAAGQGLQNAVFEGGVDYVETRPASGKSPPLNRHATSTRLIVDTKPGLGPLERADFRGSVRFVDGELTADAPRALYNIERDQLELTPPSGEAGTGPILNNRQLTVQARNIQLSPSTQKLTADTDVRSIIKPQTAAPPTAGAAPAGRGAAPAAQGQTRMPAMLKQDQPVTVTSNRLAYDGISEATYSGKALLWQDKSKSRISAETIVLNDRTGNLTARVTVRTTMMLEDEDPKTKLRRLTETRASADMLVYDEAKRLATYTATGKTPASVTSVQGDMSGNRIDLFLKEGGSELERAELDDNVAVTLPTLFATGKHLVYTAATDTHVLTGDPVVSVQKDEQGACKQTRGSTLTYQRSTDFARMGGMTGIGFQTTPLPACPVELR